MTTLKSKITPCLWFDGQAEEAARFYTSIFPYSKITDLTYVSEGSEEYGLKPGRVMVVAFELSGQSFTGLNGGPNFKFTEAISFQVECDTQDEIDYYWEKLSHVPECEMCGWLKDRYGVSWQIVPKGIAELVGGPHSEKSARAMQAIHQMKKLDIATLKKAYDG